MKLLYCKECKKIVEVLNDSECNTLCCGKVMEELIPNTVDAAVEKHVPVVNVSGREVTVQVGSTLHPMEENHYIAWIYVKTNKGRHIIELNPGDEPIAQLSLSDNEEFINAYAYCNLHGLWVNN